MYVFLTLASFVADAIYIKTTPTYNGLLGAMLPLTFLLPFVIFGAASGYAAIKKKEGIASQICYFFKAWLAASTQTLHLFAIYDEQSLHSDRIRYINGALFSVFHNIPMMTF